MSVTRRFFVEGAAALGGSAPGQAQTAAPDIYLSLVRANDELVAGVLGELDAPRSPRFIVRRVGTNLAVLAAAFCAPESARFKSADLIPGMERAAQLLLAAQHPDGTIDSGNYNSPPDTGFVVQNVTAALTVLRQAADSRLAKVDEMVSRFLSATGDPLATGGVHTPNHRWVITSALARLNSLFPAQRFVDRIDDWLGEGIDIDADGQFSERSTGIYSRVIDDALITMARLLNRPALLEPVRRNLEMNLAYAHPDGEMETVGSRRQDYGIVSYLANSYLEYRTMAIHDANPVFAAAARWIEQSQPQRLQRSSPLIAFLEQPKLRQPLPVGGAIPANYARVFPNSSLARIRRGEVSATVFGGTDRPLGVASGLSSNPTFFNLRKGRAVLESVRMGGAFFSEGVFRSAGMEVEGGSYKLHQRFDVPYYQPLPESERNARGDYALTPAADGRFWSKLDFPRRRMSNVQTLDQRVTVVEKAPDVFELHLDISGHQRIPYTIELAFRPGGTFEGAIEERVKGRRSVFKEGMARYVVGADAIEFGPGSAEHEFFDLSGHTYTAHNGQLRTTGHAVYITGFTPLRRVLTIRAAG
jgi:hypothetical protein